MNSVRKVPLRKCIGCAQMKNKKELMRVIKTSEGQILLDDTGKKNGRGAYICRDVACFEKAIKSKGLERSLKCAIPKDIYENLKQEIDKVCQLEISKGGNHG